MATVSNESYNRLIANRPYKFDEQEVNYRDSDDKEKCSGCIHFYTRKIDSFGVCEIFRPSDDDAVEPGYVCDFWTED